MKLSPYNLILTGYIVFLCADSCDAQSSDILKSSTPPVLIENKGQIGLLEGKGSADNVLFKMAVPGGDLYITNKGLSYVFYRQINNIEKPSYSTHLTDTGRNKKNVIPEILHYEVERVDMQLMSATIKKANCDITYSRNNYHYNYYRNGKIAEEVRGIEKIIIKNIFPGIDWILTVTPNSNRSWLKQDYQLHTGADARNLQIRYSSNARISAGTQGDLILKSRLGLISESKPIATSSDFKREIPVKLIRKHHTLSYSFDEPLIKSDIIIDPDLFWGTALTSAITGINYNDKVSGRDIQTDNQGNIFVLLTVSQGISFPTKNPGGGAFYQDFSASSNGGMVITKFSKDGKLLWSTYFGNATNGFALAVDPSGNVYASGTGLPTDAIPLKNNGGYYDPNYHAGFLTKFSNSGILTWCSYWADEELQINQMLCDSKGNLYLTGITYPYILPKKDAGGGAYWATGTYSQRPFISEFSQTNQLLWSTALDGWDGYVGVTRMAVDPNDNLILCNDSVRLFNANHQQTWTDATIGYPYLHDVAVDRQGDIFVVGYGPGKGDVPIIDPGNGAFIDNSGIPGYSSGFILKYNTALQLSWSTRFIGKDMTLLHRVVADKTCDAIHVYGIMNDWPNDIPTVNNSCTGGFYFTAAGEVTLTSPVLITFSTGGKLLYCSLTHFPYNYYDTNIAFTSDIFGNLIYLFSNVFPYSYIPATKDPGNGAFFQADGNNLTISAFLMKLTPSRINASVSVVNPTGCHCNGTAVANVLCGSPPYSYAWSTGAVTQTITGLCSGSYKVTITDSYCNDTTINFILPPGIGSITGFSSLPSNAHCSLADGKIEITSVLGGTSPFTYSINSLPVQTSNLFTHLLSGKYFIEIKDINGCTYHDSVTLTEVSGPDSVYASITAASCKGQDGKIHIDSIRNGTMPFQYNIDNSPFTGNTDYTLLGTGKYFVQVKDSAGCLFGDSIEVTQMIPPSGALINTEGAHCGLKDGKISIDAVYGGTTPYQYSIDGFSYRANSLFDSLPPSGYKVFIKDAQGCIYSDSAFIANLSGPAAVNLLVQNTPCNEKYGKVNIQGISGGTAPYTYSLDSIIFKPGTLLDSVTVGKHPLYIRDAYGCPLVDTFSLQATVSTTVHIQPKDTTACFGDEISFSVIYGNEAPVEKYNWNNEAGSQSIFSHIAEKEEYIILQTTNSLNCVSTDSAKLILKNCDSTADNCVHFPNAFTPGKNGRNEKFGPIAHCQVSNYQLNIFNRFGERIFSSVDINQKWNGILHGVIQPGGNYVYTCFYTVSGIRKQKGGSVILVR